MWIVFSFHFCLSSVQFSRSVVSDSLRSHELQHARPPCPSPTPGVHSNSCPSSHPLLSPFPPAPNTSQHQSLFQWLNSAWGGQSTGVSASASFPPKKSQGWSPSEWTGWISLQSKRPSRVFSNTTVQTHQLCSSQPSSWCSSHTCLYMTTGKIIILIIWTFVSKVISLLSSMLSRFAVAFLPRSKHLSAIRVVSCAYLRLLILLLAILIPACDSSSLDFTWYTLNRS